MKRKSHGMSRIKGAPGFATLKEIRQRKSRSKDSLRASMVRVQPPGISQVDLAKAHEELVQIRLRQLNSVIAERKKERAGD
jgi:hypothetical protein